MKKCPRCNGTNIVGVEYNYTDPYRYDGISEWDCMDCKYRQGRWTEKELKDGVQEPPFGRPEMVTKETKVWNL